MTKQTDMTDVVKELRSIKATLTLIASRLGAMTINIDDNEGIRSWAKKQDEIMRTFKPQHYDADARMQADLDDIIYRPHPVDL